MEGLIVILKAIVSENPNDADLGKVVREYINSLK